MNHRLCKTAAALGVFALAIVVVAVPAGASNMGFKLERTLSWYDGFFNFYFQSVPFYRSFPNWVDPANLPAGTMDTDDVLYDWWIASHPPGTDLTTLGSMALVEFDNTADGSPTDNNFFGRQIFPLDATNYLIAGNVEAYAIDEVSTPGWHGYKLELGGDPVNAPSHPIVVVGSHDPSLTQATLPIVQGFFNNYIVSVPYHTTWNNSDEVMCEMWLSTFGGANCVTQAPTDAAASITISSFDNTPGNGPVPGSTDNTYFGRQCFWTGSDLLCVGNVDPAFPVTPGEAYQFVLGSSTLANFSIPFPHY